MIPDSGLSNAKAVRGGGSSAVRERGAGRATAAGRPRGWPPRIKPRRPNLRRPERKIKLGLVGCGGRGSWIAKLFQQHGGYEMHAVADYFQDVADRCGDALGVDKGRRFSGLSGYKKVIESGVEAVALIVPPVFPARTCRRRRRGGRARLHGQAGGGGRARLPARRGGRQQATQKKQVFLVDYQMPTDPANIQVVERLHKEDGTRLLQDCHDRYFRWP